MVYDPKKKTLAQAESNKTGWLFINLGSPDAPTTDAVHEYLKQFLSDPMVIKVPRYKWWPILNGIILPFRAPRSADLYKRIWQADGSPMISTSISFTNKCTHHADTLKEIKLAMRYGNPSIESKLIAFAQEGIKSIQIVPMFPQFSDTTTGSIIKEVKRVLKFYKLDMKVQILKNFHTTPVYITSLVAQIKEQQQKESTDCILISFHGIPKSYAEAGDIYPKHCDETLEAIKKELPEKEIIMSYQSRFGKEEWLKPYTDETLIDLAKNQKSVLVLCPGFTADCLETIDEINREYRNIYEENGGKKMIYLNCLNDNDQWCKQFTTYLETAPFTDL